MTNILNVQHGEATREMTKMSLRALSGHADPGKFGRMFPFLEPLQVGDDALFALAEAMKDADPGSTGGDNPDIPAGFTYLGQFIDHDITLDLTPLDKQVNDPLATENFRSPALDLDNLYGPGPALSPFMYQRDLKGQTTAKLLIGKATASSGIADLPNDLPRTSQGRAIIGDERNDENLLVAQTHLAFLKFHNAIVDWVTARQPTLAKDEIFREAQRLARWHYQWIVLYDFVERLTEKGLVDKIRQQGRRFYRFKSRPYIPVEFAAAAYRLGHSMVRQTYDHNRVFPSADFNLLFHFTGKSGAIIGDLAGAADPGDFERGPGPFAMLPSNWVIDWRRFYDMGPVSGFTRNQSRRLDPYLVSELHGLPGEAGRHGNLAFRNLKRGVQVELPCGQDVARAIGVEPLGADEIANAGDDGAAAMAGGMHHRSPLWYYILKEARLRRDGRGLGPVGSTIVAETFLGLVHGDDKSFLWQRKNWKPELPSETEGHFTMKDLLRFVNDINPAN